ncbi:MAG: DUF3800 domain-containing protein [Terriglobia bacterium]|jgi:hypothetical protein
MQLLYVDESGGDSPGTNDKFFVLAGVSVAERVPFHLSKQVDEIQTAFFPTVTAPIEFRASAIWNKNGEPWNSMDRPKRNSCMKSLYKLIGGDSRVTLFGIVFQKPDYPNASPIARTCEEMAGRFDAHLVGLELASENKEKQRGLMIFDQSRHEKTVQALMTQYRTTGASFGKVKHLAEVPLFTDSKITRMLQVADFVAYAIYRRYESSDAQFLDIIMPRFAESGGKLHGLLHLNVNHRECTCQPCYSRRTDTV